MHLLRQFGLAAAYAGAATALLAAGGCNSAVQAAPASAAQVGAAAGDPHGAEKLHFYQTEVQPVLQRNCLRCHGGMNRRGGLNMSTRAALLQGGKDGVVVIPGRPEDSLLIRVIGPRLPEGDPMRMPPKGERLTDAEVAAIRRWVVEGVVMDR